MVRTGRPKKPPERAHTVMLRIRVLPEHDQLIREAAKAAAARIGTGDLSSWVRTTLVVAAKRELVRNGGRE